MIVSFSEDDSYSSSLEIRPIFLSQSIESVGFKMKHICFGKVLFFYQCRKILKFLPDQNGALVTFVGKSCIKKRQKQKTQNDQQKHLSSQVLNLKLQLYSHHVTQLPCCHASSTQLFLYRLLCLSRHEICLLLTPPAYYLQQQALQISEAF